MIAQLPLMQSYPNSVGSFMKGFKDLFLNRETIGITSEGIILYGLLTSTLSLSFKNQTKYSDEDGVFCRCAPFQTMEKLGWQRSKTDRAMRNLETCGLLKRKKEFDSHGIQRGTKLYLFEWHPNMKMEDYPPLLPLETATQFYSLPCELFSNPVLSDLTDRSKLVYCLLLDNLRLSEQYDRYDREGNLFVRYNAKKLASILKCSTSSITRAMDQLRDMGLAVLEQAEYCSEWRVYLRDYRKIIQIKTSKAAEQENLTVEKSTAGAVENSTSAEIILQNGETVSSNVDASLVKNDTSVSSNDAPRLNNIKPSRDRELAQKTDDPASVEIVSARCRPLPPVVAQTEDLIDSFAPPWQVPTWKKILDQIEGVLRTDLVHGRPFVYGGGGHAYRAEELLSAYGRLDPAILFVTISKLFPLWYQVKQPDRLVREALFRAAEWHGKEAKRFCCQNSLNFKGKTIHDYLGALKQRGGHPS